MIPFTFEYLQPDAYRFSLDSVEAPYEISRWILQSEPRPLRVLDLCAGCGVMGLELAFHTPWPLHIDFVEIQSIYGPLFAENLRRLRATDSVRGLSRDLSARWLEMNYESMLTDEYREAYDLVLANPPYFRSEDGKVSTFDFKARCRFFLDASRESFWDVLAHARAPQGQAFVLMRTGRDHNDDALQLMQKRLRYRGKVTAWKEIRGTQLVHIG